MTLVRDAIEAFLYLQDQEGWRSACTSARQFLLSPFFELNRAFVLRRSLLEPIDIPISQVEVAIRQVSLDDSALLETIIPPLRLRRLASKMRAGEICFAAIQGVRVVAYVFAGFAETPSTEDAQLKLRPRDAYIWGAYALPQYRRQGVVGAMNLSLCQVLQQRAFDSALLLVDRRNRAALGHCRKIGYRVTHRVVQLKLLGWRTSRCSPIDQSPQSQATEEQRSSGV